MTIKEFKLFAPRIASEDDTRRPIQQPFRHGGRAYVTDGRFALVLEACDASLVTAEEAGATTAALQLDKYITAFGAANDLDRCEAFDVLHLRDAARATFDDLAPCVDRLRVYEADPSDPGDVSTTESVRFVRQRYAFVILPNRGRSVIAAHFADVLADVLAATDTRCAYVRHDIKNSPIYACGVNWHMLIMPLRANLEFGETGWMTASAIADAATGELVHHYDYDDPTRVNLDELRFPKNKKGKVAG